MAQTPKKFLDADGLAYLAQLLNNYPNNELLSTVINAIDNAKQDKLNYTIQISSAAPAAGTANTVITFVTE